MKRTYFYIIFAFNTVQLVSMENLPIGALVVAQRSSIDGHKVVATKCLLRTQSERALKDQEKRDQQKLAGINNTNEINTEHSCNEPLRSSSSPRGGRKLSQSALRNCAPVLVEKVSEENSEEAESNSSSSNLPEVTEERTRRNTISG